MASAITKIRRIGKSGRTIRAAELRTLDIPSIRLTRLVAAGELARVARGVYALPGHIPGEHAALATVAQRAPSVVFCLMTALRFHNVTTQAPFEVWIAIPNKSRPPRMAWPKLRTVRFSEKGLTEGVEIHKVDGVKIRVTSIARTIADCFKFRNKVGLDVAIESLREALESRRTTTDALWRAAGICRVTNVMRPYLDAM